MGFGIWCLELLFSQNSFAQGPLTPPAGPPAPTMKTLDQVEPRIPIGSATTPGDADSLFRISQPGSYYLTGNVIGVAGKGGIEIAVSGVSIDLMGFELVGVAGTQSGIFVSVTPSRNISVRNGTVRNWAFSGVTLFNNRNGLLEDLRLSDNGVSGARVFGEGNVVRACVTRNNVSDGIQVAGQSVISHCTSAENGGDGFELGSRSNISHSVASMNTGHGIDASSDLLIEACTVEANQQNGIHLLNNSIVTRCVASGNVLHGIETGSNCRITDNNCAGNGAGAGDGGGIHVGGVKCRVEGNNVLNNDRGIDIDNFGNLIFRNSASGNGVNYEIAAGNDYGVILDLTVNVTAAVSGNSATGTLTTTTNPWANFAY